MQTDNNRPERPMLFEWAYRFLLGSVLGLVVASLPALFISLSTLSWQMSYIVALGGLVLLCGLLGAVLGDRFLGGVMRFLESIPPIV